MNSRQRDITSVIFAIVTIALLLLFFQNSSDANIRQVPLILFTILLTYTSVYGIPVGGGKVSLVPMIAFSSLIVMGPFASSIAIIISDLLYAVIRNFFKEKVGWSKNDDISLVSATSVNISMHVWSLLAAGYIYQQFDIALPIENAQDIGEIFTVGMTFLFTNYLLAGIFMFFCQ